MVVMDLIKVLDDMDDVIIRKKYDDGMDDRMVVYQGYTLRIPWSLIDLNVMRITYDKDVLYIDVY